MKDKFRQVTRELAAVADRLDPASVETACRMIAAAPAIVVYGCGRESLQLRGFAMRLHHLGRTVGVQGDMTAPPLGAGDLFLTSAGPGELSTVTALMRTARDAGARVLFLTGEPGTPSAALADHVLHIPAQTMASDQGSARTSALSMGSLYEGALFVLFEVMVLRLADLLHETLQTMRARHTNME
jgi:6-phospho-3-hexuloisomerase